jgi:hypothetical protein
MADPRLNSVHLFSLPRRDDYRRARERLLEARGLLTLAAIQVHDLLGEEWPSTPDRVPPGTQFVLVDREGSWVYPLRTGLNTIGRLPNNDIVLEERHISRRHCVILVHTRGGCELHDTASMNGTRVNGRPVVCEPVRLASGDWIQVCRRPLLFLSEKDYHGEFEDEGHPATVVTFTG